MTQLFQPKKIRVAESPVHGWGVFATQFIGPGEIIEECPFVELPIAFGESTPLLIDYRYNYPAGPMTPETKQVAVLGYGMIYNHSNDNSAYWETDTEKKCFRYIAKKLIKPGEEIFIYYGGAEYWADGRTNTNVK